MPNIFTVTNTEQVDSFSLLVNLQLLTENLTPPKIDLAHLPIVQGPCRQFVYVDTCMQNLPGDIYCSSFLRLPTSERAIEVLSVFSAVCLVVPKI